jgi:cystathionine gamma-synthase
MPSRRNRAPYENSITPPTYQSASFYFEDESDIITGLHRKTTQRGRYGRYNNPSWLEVEEKISALNKADKTLLFASGMAAHFTTFIAVLRAGDHVVIPSECYRQTRNVFLKILPQFGIVTHQISVRDPDAFVRQVKEFAGVAKLVHLEMPSSPHMYLTDIAEVRAAVGPDVLITLDSSFAPPTNFLLSPGA